MPRKRKFTESMVLRVPSGTFEAIDALLGTTEDRADLVRVAVAREIARLEREITAGKRRPTTTYATLQVSAPG